MSSLELRFDWEDPGGAQGAELRATWARLEIRVDGTTITRVIDQRVRSWRDYVVLPIYPLAEWLVSHWWALQLEPERSAAPDLVSFQQRHSLVHAREGFALPALSILPSGEWVQLRWQAEELPHQQISFPCSGTAWITAAEAQDALGGFITSVVERLDQQGIRATRLQDDWQAILNADPEEEAFCRCAGSLGLDPYSLPEAYGEALVDLAAQVSEDLRNEFFQAASTKDLGQLRDSLIALKQAQAMILEQHDQPDELCALKQNLGTATLPYHELPWIQGYSLARALRGMLPDDGASLHAEGLLSQLFGEGSAPTVQKAWHGVRDFVAYVGPNASGAPGFVLAAATPQRRRFLLARALGLYLWPTSRKEGLITMAATTEQKRNRAFAAELLAPADALRAAIQGPVVGSDELDQLAHCYGVTSELIRRQLANHEIATVGED
jgi:hypothetical protein